MLVEMATIVTYNGVESAHGGNMFKDVKFWVALRIPDRNRVLDMIRVRSPQQVEFAPLTLSGITAAL